MTPARTGSGLSRRAHEPAPEAGFGEGARGRPCRAGADSGPGRGALWGRGVGRQRGGAAGAAGRPGSGEAGGREGDGGETPGGQGSGGAGVSGSDVGSRREIWGAGQGLPWWWERRSCGGDGGADEAGDTWRAR